MTINIYIDCDGVLNAVSNRPPRNNTQWSGDWGHQQIEGFPILWSHELIEAINELADRDDVTIKWLTTWQDLAATSLSGSIGLNGSDWHYFVSDDMDDLNSWWKLAKIQRDIIETNPEKAVWIDDDIPFERNALKWVESCETPVYAVSPNTSHGLTKKQLNGIIDFLK